MTPGAKNTQKHRSWVDCDRFMRRDDTIQAKLRKAPVEPIKRMIGQKSGESIIEQVRLKVPSIRQRSASKLSIH